MEGQVSKAWASPLAISSWSIYFPEQAYLESDGRVQLIYHLITFWDSAKGRLILSEVELETGTYVLQVDLQAMQQSDVGDKFLPALASNPGDAVSCLAAAAHVVLFYDEGSEANSGKIKVRLCNCDDFSIPLKSLKANLVGKLVSIRGTVARMSMVRPLVTRLPFKCPKCKTVIDQQFVDGKYSPPTKCILDGCRNKTFTPVRREASTLDYQRIRIQENPDAGCHEEGRMPRTVECELTEDLVDTCLPGDVVTVCGIVKATNSATDAGVKESSSEQSLYFLYIDAMSVVNAKHRRASAKDSLDEWAVQAPSNLQDFTSKDLEFVVRFAAENGVHMFRRLVHSMCPSIYGHEILKAGIVLALFGGVQKNVRDEDKVPIRGDIHVLVVGDPGLGKSQLLQAAAAAAPRGIYVCANTSTLAGLTVAVVKDSMTGDYVFEAGAMVLADRGICCIDEFDKMTCEHQTLLEAMEQQSVSVAKAGLVASLSARTSVLAAANPVGGRYNRGKTVNENLKMGAALMSRFDLVYILLDRPNELLDQRLSKHVIALHGESAGGESRAWMYGGSTQRNETLEPVVKKLKLDKQVDRDFSPLPGPLLRKYIAYARQYVAPRMSSGAAQVLQQFYLRLRSERTETPITARQLESLIRLAEARAKLELREEITREDALDVVEIMKQSLQDTLRDEHGGLDFSKTGGMSQAKEVKRFMSALQRRSEQERKTSFTVAELCIVADDIGLRVPDLDVFIENINNAGYLLKKGCRLYQLAG